ncbi:MAG: glycyl-radical enzyme activating protein [Deltaproteobacteria bacterium]|nr:glycyl-radical enzyme activating protein [Deltaproteobacteria bacterium]
MARSEAAVLYYDLQRFCLHDGPGIRSVVFFKGCPLRCRWCQNPESLRPEPETAFYAERCGGCSPMPCAAACESGAIRPGERRIERSLCRACGRCADACPHEALRLVGRSEPAGELGRRLDADRAYFEATGGGVTLSGGEPLLQAAASADLLRRCREAGIGTTVETCGAVPWRSLARVLPLVDLFLYDLKAGTEPLARELAGTPAARAFANARRLVEAGARVELRMPVVPGLNDGEQSLQGMVEFLREIGRPAITLLRYHSGGEGKLARIDSEQPRLAIARDSAERALAAAAGRLRELGVQVSVDTAGDEPPRAPSAGEFSPRVWRLRQAVQQSPPAICPERALLVTEYFRRHARSSEPMVLQKAEALRHVLRRRRAQIYDDELLVGSFSSKRVGGSIFPELHGVAVMEDLLAFRRREVNPLAIEPAEILALATRVLPYWSTRFLALRAFPLPRALRFVGDQLGAKRYLINETGGISHFVPDYRRLLALGTSGIAAQAQSAEASTGDDEKRTFYRAVTIACEGIEELAAPYARLAREQALGASAERRSELVRIAEICERVPRLPARGLHEALQSLLFAQIALNLESLDNAVCPGRLDQLLYPYFRTDVAAGRLSTEEARELVGCFTVKMSEIVPVFSRRITRFHGGMFNGQVVVVGGTDEHGADATNELTWIFLDAMDRLRMRQPNYHARVHRHSPPEYLGRLAAMLQDGSAAPSLMNDEVVVPMLVARGTALEHARDYSPVGCVEPAACGATFGSTDAALVNLPLCLERALGTAPGGARGRRAEEHGSIEELVEAFARQVEHLVAELVEDLHAVERANARLHPTPLTSALLRGCLESGRDASAGGAAYNGSGVQAVGVADVADSLAAAGDVVYRRRICDLAALREALRRDFAGAEALRGHLLRAPKYGNGDAGADAVAARVMQIFAAALGRHRNTRGGEYWAGFYSVTAHRAFGETVGALPSGRLAGRPLASGLSPASGVERFGPTAALGSTARIGAGRFARNGVNVNLKLDAATLAGERGGRALDGLVRGYFAQGGMQLQVNVLDPALLVEARDHPGRHPWLLVRVSGYSAYFDDLSPAMKQEIIERTLHCG